MENEVCKKKHDFLKNKWCFFHNFNIGRLFSTDIFSSLYDLGTPERSKWVQEAGNPLLVEISEKQMSLQDQKKITTQDAKTRKNTMKNEIDLNGSFRGAF